MRILHFIYDHVDNPWVGGGGAVRVHELYRRLTKKGHSATVVCGNYPGAMEGFREGVYYKFLGLSKSYYLSVLSYGLYARAFLKKRFRDYDIVVEDFAPWNPIFSYKLQNKIPTLLQIHHKHDKEILRRYSIFGLPFYVIEQLYPKKFLNILSVSEVTARKFGFKEIDIIPNGVDLVEPSTITLGDYILYVGRIDFYNKGLDVLLKAVEDVDVKLFIVGKGKDSKLLENNLNSRFSLSRKVKYLGFIDELEKVKLIERCRFLVLPSRYEGQGIVVLEAASKGKPVLVSDIEELKYVVKEGIGISFRSGNSEDLREKIELLWNQRGLLEKLSKRALKYAKNFTWDRIADRYERFLLSLTQSKGKDSSAM